MERAKSEGQRAKSEEQRAKSEEQRAKGKERMAKSKDQDEGTMSDMRHEDPTRERDRWKLISAEARHEADPETFQIPTRDRRMSLAPGDAVKLLFHIETAEHGRLIDEGVDRMWVIVKAVRDGRYVGVLDNDPGEAEDLLLHLGDEIVFGAEHVADIERPPHDYIVNKYGPEFFGE